MKNNIIAAKTLNLCEFCANLLNTSMYATNPIPINLSCMPSLCFSNERIKKKMSEILLLSYS